MPPSTDTDIQELKNLILGLDKKIEVLDKKVEVFAARTEERFNSIGQRIESLDKSLNKRIDSLEQRTNVQVTFLSLVPILATSLLGILGKVVFFPVDKL
ncbi:hypothetical protein [Acaryochloris sp. IP29b_bin.137]|uniref:hypothetical protein n=1 Tax=Acaryochloris sp. IP29b_bin.137 TaxID=2969217 RepID=UPI002624DD5B|nr:hypothetical protein [Acaryochloris sp. IP29b_bin.137]